jgi:drug/metabolite transporter (DMT)-like permease
MSAIGQAAPATNRRLHGILLVGAGSVLWSTGGLFVRVLDMDFWTMQVWRSLFAALSLVVIIAAEHRGRAFSLVRAMGWTGLVAVPVSAVSMFCYVAALQLTTVANVMIVYATVPLLAAGIAFLWIGERPGRRALIAAVAALAGIAVMVGAGARGGDLAGDALALLMTVTFALLVVAARRDPSVPMAAVNALAALLGAAASYPFMKGGGVPDAHTLLILALFGVTTTGLAYLLFLLGARFIPSAEAGLLGLLDTVLAPLWVWLAFAEVPATTTLVGGGIVLLSVVWYLVGGARASMPDIRPEPRRRRANTERRGRGARRAPGRPD